jgi:enoyl-CoA hydratase/carnithine racemase
MQKHLQHSVGRTLKSGILRSRFSQLRSIQKIEEDISNYPVWVSSSPGARILELRAQDTGNILTTEVLSTIQTKLEFFNVNKTIGAVIISSATPELFSNGIDNNDVERDEKLNRIVAGKSLSSFISKMGKAVIAVYSGDVGASAYSIFASAHFRLGTTSTKFRIQEDLTRGNLPLGGLAYHLAKSSTEGVAMARYLAITQRELTAHDMYTLGLLTHIVEIEPQVTLIHALAHTMPVDDMTKAVQSSAVDASSIKDLLDTMDIESEFAEGDFLMDDPVWDRIMLVRPQKVDIEDFFEENEQAKEDLEDISAEVMKVFQADSIDECLTLLRDNSSTWSQDVREKVDNIPREVLQSWFTLTREVESGSFERACKLEEKLLK